MSGLFGKAEVGGHTTIEVCTMITPQVGSILCRCSMRNNRFQDTFYTSQILASERDNDQCKQASKANKQAKLFNSGNSSSNDNTSCLPVRGRHADKVVYYHCPYKFLEVKLSSIISPRNGTRPQEMSTKKKKQSKA